MKLFPLALAAFVSAPAFASDLANDLRVSFDPRSNPFGQVEEQALSEQIAGQWKQTLEACAYSPTDMSNGYPCLDAAKVKAECQSQLGGDEHRLTIGYGGRKFTVVSWDGSDSDGGDQLAIGVYDGSGKRVAVYPSLFSEGNVIDALAHAVDASLPKLRK